jgi:hypothetical protein
VEIQILPTGRNTKVLLYILVFHLTRQEIHGTAFKEVVRDWGINDDVAPPHILVVNQHQP